MKKIFFIIPSFIFLFTHIIACKGQGNAKIDTAMQTQTHHQEIKKNQTFEVQKTDADWQQSLDAEQYRILRQKGTERPFTSPLEDIYDGGTYVCAGCGNQLFSSEGKFDSGCGWPSFYEALDQKQIITQTDNTFGMTRTEILCAKCGGHLGHVFNDGPKDKSGLRYCVNGKSLNFIKK